MKILFHLAVVFLSLIITLNLTAQGGKNEHLKNDWVIPCKIFKKEFPLFLIGSGGISYGPEHVLGLPAFNISIQSHHKKGIYLGVQGGTALGFAYSHGVHAGIGYKWLTFDYSQTRFLSEGRNHFTHNLKAGLNFGYFWLKFGPAIINNDYSSVDRQFINTNKYQFNVEILVSNRMRGD